MLRLARLASLVLGLSVLAGTASAQLVPIPTTTVEGTANGNGCVRNRSTPVVSIPANEMVLTQTSPPVVETNGSWDASLDVSGAGGSGIAALFGSRNHANLNLVGGVLLVDPNSLILLGGVGHSGVGSVNFSVPLPNDVSLCGRKLRVQAAYSGPSGLTYTNAFDLRLGRE